MNRAIKYRLPVPRSGQVKLRRLIGWQEPTSLQGEAA
jgi:hypothetical protein